MDTNLNGFWDGFEKRASLSGAAGWLSGLGSAAGLYKTLQKGINNPTAKGISKYLGKAVEKAQKYHPALGPLLTGGIPLAGGAIVGKIVHKGTKVLENMGKHHMENIGDKFTGFTKAVKDFAKRRAEKK